MGARDAAAEAGLTIEVKRENNSPTTLMAIATGAGALLALAILAMSVGLIRGESAGDPRTLTATTAGALALLGALLVSLSPTSLLRRRTTTTSAT